MNNEQFLAEVSDWILGRTLDSQLAQSQLSRFRDLHSLLKEGIAHFWFRKSDGSLRSAYGTLNRDVIERHNGVPEGEERKGRPFSGAVPYFDLEKDAWRSFKADSVQEIDFGYGML